MLCKSVIALAKDILFIEIKFSQRQIQQSPQSDQMRDKLLPTFCANYSLGNRVWRNKNGSIWRMDRPRWFKESDNITRTKKNSPNLLFVNVHCISPPKNWTSWSWFEQESRVFIIVAETELRSKHVRNYYSTENALTHNDILNTCVQPKMWYYAFQLKNVCSNNRGE